MLFLKQVKGIFPCISNKPTTNKMNSTAKSSPFRTPVYITPQEKTLNDLMRAAAKKSRTLSRDADAQLLHAHLQNKIVKVINKALAENPLGLPVSCIDHRFISQTKSKPKPKSKLSPHAAVFVPSMSS